MNPNAPGSGPSSFLGAPGGGSSYYDRAQAARPIPPTPIPPTPIAPPPAVALAPPLPAACLSIRYENPGTAKEEFFCFIAKQTLIQLPMLRPGQPVAILVPTQPGGDWILDTKPKPGVGKPMPEWPRGNAYFRLPPIAPQHFMQPRDGTLVVVKELRFLVGDELPGYPGCHSLQLA